MPSPQPGRAWPRAAASLFASLLLAAAAGARADLEVVVEKVVTPKAGRVAANIGSVNRSVNVRMASAVVDIWVGPMPADPRDPALIRVRGLFTMENLSDEALALTVGFPVSNSEYSAFRLESFTVETDGAPRTVFNRVTGYPRRIDHRLVSGPAGSDPSALPDSRDHEGASLMGLERIGGETFQNLMVWEERFAPRQTRTIEVGYAIAVPPQTNAWETKRLTGSYKGIWPEEANNMPLDFVRAIPGGGGGGNHRYHFFDYFLTSGASWSGTIGEEVVTLHIHDSWRGGNLYSNRQGRLVPVDGGDDGIALAYALRDAEPTENLYFALERP